MEVNSTWLITSELANQRARKVLFTCNFYSKEAELKIAMFAHFKDYGRCLKIRDICMDFESYFKVHSLVSVHPRNIKLGQMTNLNMIFHVVVSDYRLVKI